MASEHDGFRLHEQLTRETGRMGPQDLDRLCPDWREREAFMSGPAELLAGAVAVTLGFRLAARPWPGADVPFLGRLAPWMPFAVRMHLAVSLLGLLSLGVYLSPAMDLAPDLPGIALGRPWRWS